MAQKVTSAKVASVVKKAKKKVTSRLKKVLVPKQPRGFFAWLDAVSPFSILIVGLCVVSVSIISSFFIDLQQWYFPLPVSAGQVSSIMFEYILTMILGFVALSIIILWNNDRYPRMFLMWLLTLAGILHVMWSMFFFGLHVIDVAFVVALALLILWLVIMLISWKRSKFAVLFLVPYLIWLATVTYFCGLLLFVY